jgi:two-component system chemotaxis response regulator CheB
MSTDTLRVMLCDDSAAIRAGLARLLESDPKIRIVAQVSDGAAALRALETAPPNEQPEVILLDLEMPVMDGMTALPLLLRRRPRPVVIVASALTQRGASQAMAALSAGAADYLPKPRASTGGLTDPAFQAELLAKVKGWARLGGNQPARPPTRPAAMVGLQPRAIAIGASTGGPQALAQFVKRLPRQLHLPVLITQHMPAGFTAMLAQHLNGLGGPSCSEARDGEALRPGHILIAPGNHHMILRRADFGAVHVQLSADPPENFCRPAVDPMLRSLATIYGRGLLAIILTGMGQDGLLGCQAVARAGGTVLAQDEASSVVWGMPGAVAKAGLAQLLAPPAALAEFVLAALRQTA